MNIYALCIHVQIDIFVRGTAKFFWENVRKFKQLFVDRAQAEKGQFKTFSWKSKLRQREGFRNSPWPPIYKFAKMPIKLHYKVV